MTSLSRTMPETMGRWPWPQRRSQLYVIASKRGPKPSCFATNRNKPATSYWRRGWAGIFSRWVGSRRVSGWPT